MKVTIGDKTVNVPQDYIDRNTKALNITEDEAIAMYLDDEGITINEEVAEITAKAKTAGAGAKATGEKVTRKPPVRQPDEVKRAIIVDLFNHLITTEAMNVDVTNIERMIAFDYEGDKYEVTLTKKRKPKK